MLPGLFPVKVITSQLLCHYMCNDHQQQTENIYYLSHEHQKTNDGPGANPESIIFGIQKNPKQYWEFEWE